MFFNKTAIGLDIADSSIEVAEVSGGAKILNLGRVKLEAGVVENGRIKNEQKLAEVLGQVFAEAKPTAIKKREVVFALPESQVFLHNFVIIKDNNKKIEEQIKLEVQASIPLEANDLVYAFKFLKEEKDKVEVLAVAASKIVIWEWTQFLAKNGLAVKLLDVEILASFRDLFRTFPKEPVLVIDIGANTSFLGVFDQSGLRYEFTLNTAGRDFTKAIIVNAGLDEAQAEEEKIKNGLASKNKKVIKALTEKLEEVVKEIKNTLEFYKEKTGLAVANIFLVGGSSQLTGLKEYLVKAVELEVQVGEAKSVDNKIPLEFVEAVGLARRALENNWEKSDPLIPLIKFPPNSRKANIDIKYEETDESQLKSSAVDELDGQNNGKSVKLQLIILLGIVVVGAGLFALYIWYQGHK